MFIELLVLAFGGVWRLKELCIRTQNKRTGVFFRLLYQLYQKQNGSSIAWNSIFDSEPTFPHGIKSIFVSGDAKIGEGTTIFQQVVIGSIVMLGSKNNGSPTIGNNCYIGAGAKVIGKVKVGNNVRIGANCVVYKDVPDNTVVVSAKQINIVREDLLDNRFFTDSKSWKYIKNGKTHLVTDQEIIETLNNEYNEINEE